MTPAAIRVRDVTVRLGGRPVIGDLSFEVADGERLVILGRSGSGKSTALRLVNRLVEPDEGRVVVLGRPADEWDPIELRRSIGYVIQQIGLFPHFTARQNVELVPRLLGWAEERRRRRTTELLELIGLPEELFGDRYPRELSGGQQQRIAVARALAADPPILLCDEPFGALDPITRRELQREFLALSGRLGTAILFVTHDVNEALLLGHRVALLENGRMEFVGSPEEFLETPHPGVRDFRSGLED
jgi:osmoprotectant transport system ATP-binding protein